MQLTGVVAACLSSVAMAGELPAPVVDATAGSAMQPALQRPRIGLVLSGGGARGLAHVGVLKMLEREHIPIDVIAGTSMGAIVGGLYASGMSAAQIETQLMMIKWDEVFANRVERPLLSQRRKEEDFQFSPVLEFGMREGELRAPLGALSGRGLETLLRRYTMPVRDVHDFSRLAIPFRAVATNMETGAPVILTQGDLALALRSSMSVPGVFAPTELDGLILGDGALVDNLPIDVARDMGADVVIAVNIGSPLAARETLASVGGLTGQMISILTEQNVQRSLALLKPVDVLITPDLGTLAAGDFDKTRELIDRGQAGVQPQLQRLAALAMDASAYRQWQALHSAPAVEDVRIGFIRFEGSKLTSPKRFADQLESAPGEVFDQLKAERDALQLAASGDYTRSDFRLLRTPEGEGLLFDLEEKPWGPNYFRVGLDLFTDFRGDSAFNIKVIHNRRWLNSTGTEWRNFAQIGQTPRLFTELLHPLNLFKGLGSDWFVAAYAEAQRRELTVYDADSGHQRGRFTRSQGRLGLDLGQPWGKFGELRLGLSYVAFHTRPDLISAEAQDSVESVRGHETGVRLAAILDQLDYVNFPTRGYRLEATAITGKRQLSQPSHREDFTRVELDGTAAISFGHTTLNTYFSAQSAGGNDLSKLDRYSYTLGGFHRLSGYRQDQLAGSQVLLGRLMAYHRLDTMPLLTRGFFMGGSLEAGNAWQRERDVSLSDLRFGSSLFVGADTALGPLYLGLTYAPRGETALYLYLGRP